jgi:ADP-ribose pyrophosphatase YjhB (NUDIX family)
LINANNSSSNNKRRNPVPTIDIIIQEKIHSSNNNNNVLLVKRKKEPFKDYFSLPGGFVNKGERVEEAVIREAEEELSVKVEPLDILGVYSDPSRDPRGHIMSITFVTKIIKGELKARDDAAEIKWFNLNKIDNLNLGFDHSQILSDYREWLKNKQTFWSSKQKKN